MKTKIASPIADRRSPIGRAWDIRAVSNRERRLVLGNRGAFSLIEILVVVALLSVIMLGLMAMFSQTQRAFNSSMNQMDVLEGGRALAEMQTREVEQITPANGGATNFYARIQAVAPVLQPLPGSGNVSRANFMEDLFFLTRENQTWSGVGYRVVPISAPGSGVGTLYRFIGTTSVYQDPAPLLAAFTNANPLTSMSRIVDGVVHFKVRAFDRNGYWIASSISPRISANWSPAVGEVGLYRFTSNAVPAFVELEIGILETRTLERYRSIAVAAAQRAYLANHVGQVHLFRRRIAIRNVDPLAYPEPAFP